MKASRIKIDIENLYISKPLERETYLKIVGEHRGTIHSLYLITNELKSMHYYLSLDDHPIYEVSAYISINHGYCGKARRQIAIINCMSEKLKQRPSFKLTYKIINRQGQISLVFTKSRTYV